MQHRVDQVTGLQQRPPAAPFPIGPNDLTEALLGAVEKHPERAAIIGAERTVTFAELRIEVDRLAGKLAAIGITPGDRVAVAATSGLDSVILFLAAIRAGGIWLGIHPRSLALDRDRQLAAAEPKVVLHSATEADALSATTAPLPPVNRSSPAALAFTSGTTGLPKGAVHSHQQLLYPGAVSLEAEPPQLDERIGTPLPLATLNIMLLGPITALVRGATYVDMIRKDAVAFAADVHTHRVSRTLLVPTLVHDLLAKATPELRKSLATLTTVLVGGSRMPTGMMAASRTELGLQLTASYGLSEAPTGVARRTVDAPARALPGIDIAVDAATGEITLAPETAGPWAGCWSPTLGYWRLPSVTEELYTGGRLHTGDYGSVDSNGDIEVRGRGVDMILRGGTIIAPNDIEQALLQNPAVTDAAAFGLPDARLGEKVAAAVVLNTSQTEADLIDATRPHLAAFKVPSEVHIVASIPRNAAGKVDRRGLRHSLAPQPDD